MLDHYFKFPDGSRIPVSELSDRDLARLLVIGVRVENPEFACGAKEVMKRLDLERFIRANGLRK